MDMKTMYAWITLIEVTGIYDFQGLPTLGDSDNVAKWFEDLAKQRETKRNQQKEEAGFAAPSGSRTDNPLFVWLEALFGDILTPGY